MGLPISLNREAIHKFLWSAVVAGLWLSLSFKTIPMWLIIETQESWLYTINRLLLARHLVRMPLCEGTAHILLSTIYRWLECHLVVRVLALHMIGLVV